jgi:hypothetical protein
MGKSDVSNKSSDNSILPHQIWKQRIIYFIFIFAATALTWIFDHEPKFYFGDSGSYINTAIYGYIPPDRSFIYGFLIRIISLPFQSLKPLLLTQALAGFVSCIALFALLKRFGISDRICFLITLLFSLEPMHMMWQRFVLTESFSMPIFMVYLYTSFSYLKNPTAKTLLLVQILGLFLISLRMIFLPMVLANALIAPIFAYVTTQKESRKLIGHLSINLVSILILHGSYCILNGKLSKAPPAYSYWDGFFQLSAWAPAVTAESAANQQVLKIITQPQKFPLEEPLNRVHHLWNKDGLTGKIRAAAPNLYTANSWAKITALRTLKSNPLGVLKVGATTFLWFSGIFDILNELRIDRGDDIPMSSNLLLRLRDFFSADKYEFVFKDGKYWQKSSLTKKIQDRSGLWFFLLPQTPWFCLITTLFRKADRMSLFYLACISLVYLLTLFSLMPLMVIRLLYPMTVPFFICTGICLKR